MLLKTRAIVLHHVKYGESSILLYCYTAHYGRMTYLVSGVRSKKSKIPAYYFQPLVILDVLFYYKANRALFRLKDITCPVKYTSIPFDTRKGCIAMFVAEVLYRTLHEEESNPQLFDFCEHAFQALDRQVEGTANFHLVFMLQFSKYLGIYPSGLLDSMPSEMETDLQVFHDLPEEARKAVVRMLKTDWSGMSSIGIDHKTRILIMDQVIKFYQVHMQGVFRLKSLQVMKEVFN